MSGQDSPITLALNYQHSVGWLRPYFDALAEGRALATRCDTCGKVWMPPRPACPDGHGATTWHELPATGRIVALTATTTRQPLHAESAAYRFVLVAMDGADNAMFGRLAAGVAAEVGQSVRLAPPPEAPPHPAQAAVFEPIESEKEKG